MNRISKPKHRKRKAMSKGGRKYKKRAPVKRRRTK